MHGLPAFLRDVMAERAQASVCFSGRAGSAYYLALAHTLKFTHLVVCAVISRPEKVALMPPLEVLHTSSGRCKTIRQSWSCCPLL